MDFPTIISSPKSELDLNAYLPGSHSQRRAHQLFLPGWCAGRTTRCCATKRFILTMKLTSQWRKPRCARWQTRSARNGRSIEGIVIVQRIGRLYPGTPTTLIACTSAHRNTGVFEAARYGIDRLKEIVPVWKKEIGPQGEEWVEGHYHPKPGE